MAKLVRRSTMAAAIYNLFAIGALHTATNAVTRVHSRPLISKRWHLLMRMLKLVSSRKAKRIQ